MVDKSDKITVVNQTDEIFTLQDMKDMFPDKVYAAILASCKSNDFFKDTPQSIAEYEKVYSEYFAGVLDNDSNIESKSGNELIVSNQNQQLNDYYSEQRNTKRSRNE